MCELTLLTVEKSTCSALFDAVFTASLVSPFVRQRAAAAD